MYTVVYFFFTLRSYELPMQGRSYENDCFGVHEQIVAKLSVNEGDLTHLCSSYYSSRCLLPASKHRVSYAIKFVRL